MLHTPRYGNKHQLVNIYLIGDYNFFVPVQDLAVKVSTSKDMNKVIMIDLLVNSYTLLPIFYAFQTWNDDEK